ncbi:MAG: hypothetical protein PHG63_03135 [Candidatus Dojkabacteria bacterium]|nr:hypothetical protein [Candidatus Dojkabacteria bacterium]
MRSLYPVFFVIVFAIVIIFVAWWSSPYLSDLQALMPGYYQNEEYTASLDLKNDLLEENAELLSQKDEMEAELEQILLSPQNYPHIIEKNNAIISILETARMNQAEIVTIDEELLDMRLPGVVNQYLWLSHELDVTRLDLVQTSIDIATARRDVTEFNKQRNDFDECLSGINWAGADTAIASAVSGCTAHIPVMRQSVVAMEDRYGIELEKLQGYLTLLQEQWEASTAYYVAISESNYMEANQHDEVFVARKREISELDLIDVFNEFYEEALNPMIDRFGELSEDETVKKQRADGWYEQNVRR